MRVLQVNNFHFPRGGSDRYFLEISGLLQENGHHVGTFAANHPKTIRSDLLVTTPPAGVDTQRAGGISNIQNYLYSSEAKQRMVEAIQAFNPEIAHLHIYYGQLTASILEPLRQSGIPIVQTLHEYKLVCPTNGLYAQGGFCDACQGKQYWHALFKRCNRDSFSRSALSMVEAYLSKMLGASRNIDHFIAVSEFQKKLLVKLGVSEKKLSVLYHFINSVDDSPEHEGEYFLYVGRITGDKGIGVLLEAYSQIEKCYRLPLKIVGDGVEINQWKLFSENLSLNDEVEWLGFKDGKELNDLYRGCLAVINPSLLNETFGLTCLEALAQGRPVIASDIGAFPEVFSNGVEGILVPPGDVSSLSRAMVDMARAPSEAFNMGIQAMNNVRMHFSRQKHYEGLMKIYGLVSNK